MAVPKTVFKKVMSQKEQVIKTNPGDWFDTRKTQMIGKDTQFLTLGSRSIMPGKTIVQRAYNQISREFHDLLTLDAIINKDGKSSVLIGLTKLARGVQEWGASSTHIELKIGSSYCFGNYILTVENLGRKSAKINISK